MDLSLARGIVDFHVPLDSALLGCDVNRPGSDLFLEQRQRADSASADALAGEAAQFVLGDVELPAVRGRVAELQAPDVPARLLGRERFVEGAGRVCVEVVADQRHPFASGVAAVQQRGDFRRPIGLGPLRASGRLTPLGVRFAEHENRRRAVPLVLVFDPQCVPRVGEIPTAR